MYIICIYIFIYIHIFIFTDLAIPNTEVAPKMLAVEGATSSSLPKKGGAPVRSMYAMTLEAAGFAHGFFSAAFFHGIILW